MTFLTGSPEAKEVLEKAGKLCSRKTPAISQSSKQDVEFKVSGGMDKGGDIKLTLNVHNVGSEGHIVDVYLGAFSTFYTGVTSAELKKVVSSLVLEPKKGTNCGFN